MAACLLVCTPFIADPGLTVSAVDALQHVRMDIFRILARLLQNGIAVNRIYVIVASPGVTESGGLFGNVVSLIDVKQMRSMFRI